VTDEVTDVLKDESCRAVGREHPVDVEKQVALAHIFEPVLPAKRVLLRYPAMENGRQGKPASNTSKVGMLAASTCVMSTCTS